MNSKRKREVMLFGMLLVILTAAMATSAQEAPQSSDYAPIAVGLNSPRHLAFGPDGALYVAEAGTGGDVCAEALRGVKCIGETGAITKIEDGVQDRIVSDLVSISFEDAVEPVGPHDVAWDDAGNLMVIVGLGDNPNIGDASGPFGAISENLGQLVQVAADGTWMNVIDVAAYEASDNPDGGDIDSNPYAIERVDDGYLVADAGANALLHVADDGTITTVAVFPDRMVEFPPGSGDMIPMQAVPTSIAVGADGAYYVGELTGFPFPVGGANVYRVVPGEEPAVYADGFTNIVDLAFDEAGNLYVVEYATHSILSGDPNGAVIRVDEDGNKTQLSRSGLIFPGGVAVGPDGILYVTTHSSESAIGEVVRLLAEPKAFLPIVLR